MIVSGGHQVVSAQRLSSRPNGNNGKGAAGAHLLANGVSDVLAEGHDTNELEHAGDEAGAAVRERSSTDGIGEGVCVRTYCKT